MSTTSSDFMEFHSICWCLILGSIKSNMREIVPNRERYSWNNIGEKEFIEHKEYAERKDDITMTHDIEKYWWCFHNSLVILSISKPYEKCSHLKNVSLLHHIEHRRDERKKKKHPYKNILYDIESLVARLRDHESPMERK
jgi:hypothetical protein